MPSGRVLASSLLIGGALFNLYDALVTHWVLGLHHIHEGSYETLSDVVYFAVSLLIGLAGLALARPHPGGKLGRRGAGVGSAT